MKKDASLFVSLYIAVFIGLIVFLLARFPQSNSPEATPSAFFTITSTNVFVRETEINPSPTSTLTTALTKSTTPTSTLEHALIFTSTPFPSPATGPITINSPRLFYVEGWNNNNAECDPYVIIYGVTISHGTPPYKFTFWTQNEPYTLYNVAIRSVLPLNNLREYVEFEPPVVAVKGKYKHVELTFKGENGEQVTWIDDLLFPFPDTTVCK